MNLRSHRGALTAAALITVAVAGAGAGAGVYASFGSGGSTTVVSSTTVETRGQPVSATSGLTINDIYKRTYQGVVDITVQSTSNNSSFGFGGSQSQEAEGSGFVYDAKGDIVTNDHVVDGASSIIVKFSNGATYKAHVVGTDPSTDLALIKVSAPSSVLHPLTLGD